MPTQCEHGITIDWGDFEPYPDRDPDDPGNALPMCAKCEAKPKPVDILVNPFRDGGIEKDLELLGLYDTEVYHAAPLTHAGKVVLVVDMDSLQRLLAFRGDMESALNEWGERTDEIIEALAARVRSPG